MARHPLSPHWTVYRFGYTMSLSLLHRFMGLVLSVGLLVLVGWLCAAAAGPEAYEGFIRWLPLPLVKAGLALLTLAFVYHLANGVRHLCWDAGLGFERAQARRSAGIVLAFTVVVGAVALYVLFSRGAAA